MIVRHTVSPCLPPPARNVLQVLQAALKIKSSAAEQLVHSGAVRCQGRVITQTHHRFSAGDEVEIDYAPQPISIAAGKRKPSQRFEIVHDDEAIIVVSKPAGLLTVPTPKREGNTLQSQVRKWLEQRQPGRQAICVHRLDRGVSGLLVFAKSIEVADAIRQQFAERKPDRRYVTLVQGKVSQPTGTIRSHLATDENLNRYSVADASQGELAITHYQTIEHWEGVSLLQVKLETGRRNQIRIHLAEAGHPILGDPRYLPRQAEHPLWPYKRIALHAESLGIEHPLTHERLLFASPWPQEFRDLRRRLTKTNR